MLEGFHSHPIFVAALSPLFLKEEVKCIPKVTDVFVTIKVKIFPVIINPLTLCYYHVTYAFPKESPLFSCLNV